MGKYGEALGIIEIPIKSVVFKIKPTKGDNLRLADIRKTGVKNPDKMDREFVAWFVSIVAREEGFEKGSVDYEELELFVEFNLELIMEQVYIKFGWTTEEKLRQAEEKALDAFQKRLSA